MTDTGVIDLLDPTFWQPNPHDVWTRLRADDPLHEDVNGILAVTRHADLLTVERDAATFSSKGAYRAVEEPGELTMISQDDPEHLAQRRLVNRRFTPKAVRAHVEEFRDLVVELITPGTEAGELEVVEDLAAQLPSKLTCRLLGLPDDDWRNLKSWSERLMRLDARGRDSDVFQETMAVNIELYGRVQQEYAARKGCPGEGLLDTWVNGGEIWDEARVFMETGLFVSGGAETTRTVIAHGLRAFCDHPDQWERLAAEPDLIPLAVDEMIRWVTPLNNMFRKATVDTQLDGRPVRAGQRLALVYPSANRDERVFADPFTFDSTRHPNPHLSFGYGTHFCIGANFARQELAIMLAELTQRWTNLRPITEPDVEPNIFARAVRSFRLGFDRR